MNYSFHWLVYLLIFPSCQAGFHFKELSLLYLVGCLSFCLFENVFFSPSLKYTFAASGISIGSFCTAILWKTFHPTPFWSGSFLPRSLLSCKLQNPGMLYLFSCHFKNLLFIFKLWVQYYYNRWVWLMSLDLPQPACLGLALVLDTFLLSLSNFLFIWYSKPFNQ